MRGVALLCVLVAVVAAAAAAERASLSAPDAEVRKHEVRQAAAGALRTGEVLEALELFAGDDDGFHLTLPAGHRARRVVMGEVPGSFEAGDTLPTDSFERDVVGDLRTLIKQGSEEYHRLAQNTDVNIKFLDDVTSLGTQLGETNRMTDRLAQVLSRMAKDVRTLFAVGDTYPFRLAVRRAYLFPAQLADAETNNLHYEGRSAEVTLWDTRTSEVVSSTAKVSYLMLSAWGALTDSTSARADWVRFSPGFFAEVSVVPDGCGATLDLAFLLDGSGSVNAASDLWKKQLDFVRDAAAHFTLSSEDTRVAIVTFHGPRVSHYSYLSGFPDCPLGTVFEATGQGCVCPTSRSICTDPDNTGLCQEGNYAYVPGACDNGVDASEDCEYRWFFPHDCTTCSCEPLGPQYTPEDSYSTNMEFSAAQADATITSNSLQAVLDTMADNFPDGATHLSAGLQRIDNYIFRLATGMRPYDAAVPRVLITLTDGKSNPGFEPHVWADKLQAKGIIMYSVGVGEFYQPEVEALASDPVSRHAYSLASASSLFNIIDRLTFETCELAGNLEAAQPVAVTLKPDDYRYFRGVCNGSSTDLTRHVIVEALDGDTGKTAIFVSSKHSNPSPLRHEKTVGFDTKSKVIFHDRKVDGTTGPLYVALQGSPSEVSSKTTVVFYQSIFSQYERTVSVLENSASGTAVGAAPTMETIVGYTPTYRFSRDSTISGDNRFAVDPDTGVITVAGGLDRERDASYLLKIWAEDATRCLKGYQLVTIQIDDKADNKPVFSQTLYTASLQETPRPAVTLPARRRRAVGDVIVTVSASDADLGATLTYRITSGNSAGFFALDASTGELTQVADVDYELVSGGVIELSVVANDGTEDSLPATIRITVQDVNEDPYFSGLGADHAVADDADLTTGSLIGSVALTLTVKDDSTKDTFACVLTGNAEAEDFLRAETRDVDGTRECRVRSTKTLRAVAGTYTGLRLLLNSGAGTLLDYADFNLVVSATNDNRPKFDAVEYTIRVSRVEPVGSVIVVPSVTDADGDTLTCSIYEGAEMSELVEVVADASGGNTCTYKLKTALTKSKTTYKATVRVTDSEKEDYASLTLEVYDGCPMLSDCVNGTACAEGLTSTCECVQGPTVPGQPCAVSGSDPVEGGIDYCAAAGSPCQHGSTCTNQLAQLTYSCDKCPVFIEGKDCDVVVDKCSPSPCLNGGSCARVHVEQHGKPLQDGPDFDDDVLNSFECTCPDTHFGVKCQTIDPTEDACLSEPCQNGGTCSRTVSRVNGPKDAYECACPANTFGSNCELARLDCDPNKACEGVAQDATCTGACQNGGTCEATLAGGDCDCPDSHFGATCENTETAADACASNPCRNDGVCERVPSERNGPKDAYECVCPEGTDGDRCELTSTACTSGTLTCDNGATCAPSTNGGVCECAAAPLAGQCYTGRTCARLVNCDSISLGSSGSNSSASSGMVAGVVVGVVVLCLLLLLLVVRKRRSKTPTQPVYESQGEAFENPTFMAMNKGHMGDEGPDALSNPFYGVNAAMGDIYSGGNGAGGDYDTVAGGNADTYDTVGGGGRGMDSNRHVQVENGRMRLASVSRHNPLVGAGAESSTDDVDGFNNPMYAAGTHMQGALPGMSNPGYSSTYGNNSGPGGVSNPGYKMMGGGHNVGYDSAAARDGTYGGYARASDMPGRSGGSGGYDSATQRPEPQYDVGRNPNPGQGNDTYLDVAGDTAGDDMYLDVARPGAVAPPRPTKAPPVNDTYFVANGRAASTGGYDSATSGFGFSNGDPAYDTAAPSERAYDTAAPSEPAYDTAGAGFGAYDSAAAGKNSEGAYDYATRR